MPFFASMEPTTQAGPGHQKKVTFKDTPREEQEETLRLRCEEEEPFITVNKQQDCSCRDETFQRNALVNPCLTDPLSPVKDGKNTRTPTQQVTCDPKDAPPDAPTQEKVQSPEKSGKTVCPELGGAAHSSKKCTARQDVGDALCAARSSKSGPYDGVSATQRLTDRLKEFQLEEEFRRSNPVMRQQKFKHRGVCGSLGNPVFSSTPVSPPHYQAMDPAHRLPGYDPPRKEHPMYSTTSAEIGGREPYLECTPIAFYPHDQSFTIKRAIGGMYEDAHLTTELNKDTVW